MYVPNSPLYFITSISSHLLKTIRNFSILILINITTPILLVISSVTAQTLLFFFTNSNKNETVPKPTFHTDYPAPCGVSTIPVKGCGSGLLRVVWILRRLPLSVTTSSCVVDIVIVMAHATRLHLHLHPFLPVPS